MLEAAVILMGGLYAGTTPATARVPFPHHEETMDQQNISNLLKRYEKALNASDVDAVMALYGQDPIFMPQNARAMLGRAGVRKAYDHVFATLRLAIAFDISEIEVLGDQAWARTSSAGRQTLLASGKVTDEGNNELFVLRREAGEWRIHRYLFATNRPPAPEAGR